MASPRVPATTPDDLIDSTRTCAHCGMVTVDLPETCPRCGRWMAALTEEPARFRHQAEGPRPHQRRLL